MPGSLPACAAMMVYAPEAFHSRDSTPTTHRCQGALPAAEIGARRDSQRGVLAGLAEVDATPLQVRDHGPDERTGDAGEEVEAGREQSIDERVGRNRSAQRVTSAQARSWSSHAT